MIHVLHKASIMETTNGLVVGAGVPCLVAERSIVEIYNNKCVFSKTSHLWNDNRMAWQWAETLVEIRGILAEIRGTTKYGSRYHFPKHEFKRPVCLEAHHYFFTIFAMQIIVIHIKADFFVKCAHLHPGYAANLVARRRYYHCQWTVLTTDFVKS